MNGWERDPHDDEIEEEEPYSVSTQNRSGLWVPAIPLPFYGLAEGHWWQFPRNVYVCQEDGCDEEFRREVDYRGHYALVHILELD